MYFPKRLELSLRMVFALPKAYLDKGNQVRRESDRGEAFVYALELTFQNGCGLQDLLLYPGVLAADGCQELQDQLGALRLSSSRLAAGTRNRMGQK